jgi:EAL domain-containing protein (putative c-di-GMP-specific phosphodiesterase class I)
MHVDVAIDDFGTGYSSLSYLRQFPVQSLKIDRSFVCEISEHGEPVKLASAIIAMAHSLGFKVIAEGIALPLVHTAWITALVFTVLNAALLSARIGVENRALASLT